MKNSFLEMVVNLDSYIIRGCALLTLNGGEIRSRKLMGFSRGMEALKYFCHFF
jgi:hypothetical protein